MKKIYALLCTALFSVTLVAQAPQKISYQAVIRNSSHALVTSTQIGMQISILQGSTSGSVVYAETQTPTTNENGLVSIEIGTGTLVSGDFSTIDWSAGPYFIKTEVATAAPLTTYTITAVSELLSVPYALDSKASETTAGVNGTKFADLSTGILMNTTGTGVPSIATALDFPTLNQNTTGSAATFTGSLAGEVTGTMGATVVGNSAVLNKVLTGYTKGAGVISATDNILQAIQKLDANDATNANLTGDVTSVGNATTIANQTTMTATLPISVTGSPTVIATSPVAISIAPATTTTAGSMSAADKAKLDALSPGVSHYLGEVVDGGVVFYLYKGSDGTEHGLIAAPIETGEASTQWGDTITDKGATSTWDGASNTTPISATNTAIQTYLTSVTSLTGASGWYIPSIDELRILFNNRYWVNKTIAGGAVTGGVTILFNDYWSSTEIDTKNATSLYFTEGHAYQGRKTGYGNMRAIKSF